MTRIPFGRILAIFGLARLKPGLIPVTTRQMANFLYYGNLFSQIKDIDGSIVECGVGKGRSFLYFNFLASKEGKGRMVWGFDSFEGFPEPTSEDESSRKPKKGDWSDVSVGHIRDVLKTAGIPESWAARNVRLVKGFFDKTLSEYDGAPIALLHVDADLYESYMEVLVKFFPLVAPGGVVLFDEYDEPKWPGAKRAVDEYFAKTPYRPLRDRLSGKHYLVKA